MPAIPEIRGMVARRMFFNDDPTVAGWERAVAFAMQSSPGEAPTFDVRLDNGAVFSHIPPHRFCGWRMDEATAKRYVPDSLKNTTGPCPKGPFVVETYPGLAGLMRCYAASRYVAATAEYRFSLIFDDENFHVGICQATGRVYVTPQRRVMFGTEGDVPLGWKVLRKRYYFGDD